MAGAKASDLVQRMALDVRYMDVTFETLSRPDFLETLQQAYPHQEWSHAHDEFRATGPNES